MLRDFINAGWKAVKVDAQLLRLLFSYKDSRKVQPGGYVQWDNRFFHHDELALMVSVKGINPKVDIFMPSHDPRCVFFQDIKGQWQAALPAGEFGYVGHSAGPEFKKHLEKKLRVYLHDLKGDCGRIYWEDEMQRNQLARPEIPFHAEITPEHAVAQQQLIEQQAAQISAAHEREATPKAGQSQWISPDEIADVIGGVKWVDDD